MSDISSKEKRELARQRREAAKQAQKYHKEQKKKAKKSSDATQVVRIPKVKKKSGSKIEEAVNSGKTAKFEKISREEKFRRESEERIRNLEPQDFEDGYYIDEYSEKQRSERRAQVIRKQEHEVIRRNKKPVTQKQARNRRILIGVAILLAVLVIGAILSLTVLFKTEKIDIDGDEYYYEDQIIAFSNVSLQQNIFLAAMGGTPQEIVKNLPYVEDAKISFAIPDTVTIKITNAMPAYYVKDGEKYLIISSKGRVLDTETEVPEDLTELVCKDFSNKEVGSYIEFEDKAIPDILETVANSLKNNGLDNITAFDVTDPSSIKINYAGRIVINIGVAEDIEYKIKTAAAIITQKLDPNKTGQVYGTLDVSTCSKNKMSHFKPAETQPATEPASTAPAQSSDGGAANGGTTDDWSAGTYDWSAGVYDWSGGVYDNGTQYDNGVQYDAGAGTENYGGYDANAGGANQGYDANGGNNNVVDNGGNGGNNNANNGGNGGNNNANNGGYNGGDVGGAGADGAAPY